MSMRKDPLRLAIQVGVYIVIFFGIWLVAGVLFEWLAGNFAGPTSAVLFAALFATWLALRIYEDKPLAVVGLWWNRASADNLAFGLAGGVAAACLVLAPPLAVGASHIVRLHDADFGGIVFASIFVAVGSAGEELFFRGYGFQLLLASLGPWATIVPTGVAFGLMHAANPNASWIGLANTAGFGMLFGYAYVRSRDLWLPIGLHFGWNFTLPFFGANLSGITIINEVTGHRLSWNAGILWSGGDYGPEASLLTTVVVVLLFAYVYRAPVRRQYSPLTDPSPESAGVEPSSLPSSPFPPPPSRPIS